MDYIIKAMSLAGAARDWEAELRDCSRQREVGGEGGGGADGTPRVRRGRRGFRNVVSFYCNVVGEGLG